MQIEKQVENKAELKKKFQQSALTDQTKNNISDLALHSSEKWVTAMFDLDQMRTINTMKIEPSAYTYAKKSNLEKCHVLALIIRGSVID